MTPDFERGNTMLALSRTLLIVLIFYSFIVKTILAAEHPGYVDAPDRRTTGIGKFYMNREISFVMGRFC